MRNAIVGQSGGPTAAINATLSGVIKGCIASKKIDVIYGMFNGIEGLLEEKVCNLTEIFKEEKNLLSLEKTPSAALGSCRKKLPKLESNDERDISEYNKLFSILDKFNIGYYFYIGGNDSMDTIDKLSSYAVKIGSDIKFIGVPKTIDNDLMSTDHTPGYASAAKFVSTAISEILCDTSAYTVKAVTLVEIMGRDAGWLTLSSALPRLYGKSAPDLVYLPEVDFDVDEFVDDVKKLLEDKPNIVVALSEGIRDKYGVYIAEGSGKIDAFGHKSLGGAGKVLESILKDRIGCKARTVEFSLLQRCAAHIASRTDIDESVMIGKYAVEIATDGYSGYMVAYERENSHEYKIIPKKVDVNDVANAVRKVPLDFINKEKNNISDKGLKWIAPLVIGESIPDFEDGLPVQFIIKK